MAWLAGWDNRIKMTIDKDQVDGDLENFPVPIYLSTSSGQSNDDVTAIFDELSTVSGTKKIAITTDDEETQCYVEIERWDWDNEKAWLHTKIPTIASGTDTDIYIYYDKDHTDNTSYVGDVESTPAQAVWDSNFKAVYHLGEDPSGYADGGTTHLDEDMADISDWVDADNINGVSSQTTFDSKSCMMFDTNAYATNNRAHRTRDVGTFGNRVVVEFSIYLDSIGTNANIDDFAIQIRKLTVNCIITLASDNLFVYDGATYQSVGSSLVELDTWQKWVFDIDFTTPASATVDIYLDDILVGDDIDCSHTGSYTEGHVYLALRGQTLADNIAYVDYIKIGNGFRCIKDSTSNGYNGATTGAMTSDNLVDGQFGNALDFDGTDDGIIITGNSLNTETELTLEAVFNLNTLAGVGNKNTVIRNSSVADTAAMLQIDNDTVRFFSYISSAARDVSSDTVSSGTWYYSAGRWKTGESIDVFVNTTEVVGSVYSGAINRDITNWEIANWNTVADRELEGIICEVRTSDIKRSSAWLNTTYEGLWDNLLTFGTEESEGIIYFTFSEPIPTPSGTVYGITQQLQLTTTITGSEPNYIYDAVFYDNVTILQIGSTVSGVQSGEQASVYMDTPFGIEYSWYMEATSSGQSDTSSVYSFENRFLFSGDVYEGSSPASGIPVRLYRRNTGHLVGSTTSAGVSGTFEIESTYNEDHYIIALYTMSGTNALIYDYISP
jgi:hypothetical protein